MTALFLALLELTALAMPPQGWRNLATRRLNSYLPCLQAARPYLSSRYQGLVKSDGQLALMALPSGPGFYVFTGPALGSKVFSVDFSRIEDPGDRHAACYTFTIPGRPEPIELLKRGQSYVFRESWDPTPPSCDRIDQVVGDTMKWEAARASGATESLGGLLFDALKTIPQHFKTSGDQDYASYEAVLGAQSVCHRSLSLTDNVDLAEDALAEIRKLNVAAGARAGIRRAVEALHPKVEDSDATKRASGPDAVTGASGVRRPPVETNPVE